MENNNSEIWKDIPCYKGYYQASNLGRVRSLDRKITQMANGGKKSFTYTKKGRVLSQNVQNNGYLQVSISIERNRKVCTVHRLVASAFIENPNNLPDINHKDGDKKNNNVENLEWITKSENIKHSHKNPNRKKTSKPIRCVETGVVYSSYKEASEKTKINRAGISHVVNGRNQTAGGFKWERA